MYNRYIPQSDGTYRRNRIPDAAPRPVSASREPIHREISVSEPPCPPPQAQQTVPVPHPRSQRPLRREPNRDPGVLSFLRQLLPKDFDSSDLMVVLLLLLMSGDCAEDQNSALLTLALYLFL